MSAAPASDHPRAPFGWRFSFPLLLGSTLNPINSSMIATALVGIGVDFHTGPGETASLVSVLYLCSSVMQPTMGKLATIFGPRRVFLSGVAILLAAGVIGALAPAFWVLLLSRAMIGVGTSACYPTAMALVRRRADRLQVGVPSRVLGNFSIAAQVTIVVGLPLGGVLAGAFGWRAIFLVNVPLALLTLGFAFVAVEADPPLGRRSVGAMLAAVDLPGIALFAGTVLGLLAFLAGLARPAWWQLAATLVLGAGFAFWELRSRQPLIDLRMLASNRPLQRTYLRQLLFGLGVYTTLYGTSQWMEGAAGYSALATGLILLPLSAVSIVIARLASARGWVRWPLILAALALIAGGVVMLALDSDAAVAALVGMSMLFGCTNGFGGYANQTALYTQSPADTVAVAAGLYRTFAYVGAIFSASLIGLAFGARVSDLGFHRLAWVVVAIGVASLALAGLDRRIPWVVSSRDGLPMRPASSPPSPPQNRPRDRPEDRR